MTEVLFAHASPWMPRVIRAAGELRLELAAGAHANHDARTFAFPDLIDDAVRMVSFLMCSEAADQARKQG